MIAAVVSIGLGMKTDVSLDNKCSKIIWLHDPVEIVSIFLKDQ
jgi:hypothetical protein